MAFQSTRKRIVFNITEYNKNTIIKFKLKRIYLVFTNFLGEGNNANVVLSN